MPEEITEHRSFEDWAGELRELVTDAVRVHLVSDVEVGVFLSGGIDSSSTLGLMSRFAQRPVKAFSIGFERNTGFDETPFAETAAERFGAELFHTYFTASHVFDLARDVVRHLEEPLGDPACLPTYLLAQHARRHVKVVLSGEGADELFAGYGYYQRLGSMGNRLKGALRDLGSRLSRTGRQGHNGGLRLPKRFKDRSPLSGYPYAFSPSAVEYLLPDLPAGFMKDIGATTSNFERSLLPRAPHADALAKALHVDSQCFLPDDLLIKVDRMTMGHSLEARVPFLDYRVVELAMRMPSDAKLRNGRDKAVLRAAFGDLIGPVIANRQKHGFNLPMGEWITNELEPLVTDGLRIENLSACPWLSETGVRAVLDAHAEGRSSFERQIWMLYVLTAWFRDAQNQGPVRS